MHEIASHRVAGVGGALLPLHLVVQIVGMILANVVLPSRGTTGRTCDSKADAILKAHRSAVLQAVMGDDIVAKHIHILLNRRTQISDEILHVFHEIGIDVVLKSTYSVIILDKASASGLLHAVEHVFAVTHTVKECGESSQVLSDT